MNLSSLFGGGQYVPMSMVTQQEVPIGSGSDLISLTAPAGKRIRIESLSVRGNNNESGITITKDGETFISGGILDSIPINSNEFAISQVGRNRYLETNISTSSFDNVISDFVGSQITVTKDSGVTSAIIYFSYTIGQ